jgi:hypothetical protein
MTGAALYKNETANWYNSFGLRLFTTSKYRKIFMNLLLIAPRDWRSNNGEGFGGFEEQQRRGIWGIWGDYND